MQENLIEIEVIVQQQYAFVAYCINTRVPCGK